MKNKNNPESQDPTPPSPDKITCNNHEIMAQITNLFETNLGSIVDEYNCTLDQANECLTKSGSSQIVATLKATLPGVISGFSDQFKDLQDLTVKLMQGASTEIYIHAQDFQGATNGLAVATWSLGYTELKHRIHSLSTTWNNLVTFWNQTCKNECCKPSTGGSLYSNSDPNPKAWCQINPDELDTIFNKSWSTVKQISCYWSFAVSTYDPSQPLGSNAIYVRFISQLKAAAKTSDGQALAQAATKVNQDLAQYPTDEFGQPIRSTIKGVVDLILFLFPYNTSNFPPVVTSQQQITTIDSTFSSLYQLYFEAIDPNSPPPNFFQNWCQNPTNISGTNVTTPSLNDPTPIYPIGVPPICFSLDLQAIYNILNSTSGQALLYKLMAVTQEDVDEIINAIPVGGKDLTKAIARLREDYCVVGIKSLQGLKTSVEQLYASGTPIDPSFLSSLILLRKNLEFLIGENGKCPLPEPKDYRNISVWEDFAANVQVTIDEIACSINLTYVYNYLCKSPHMGPCTDPNLIALANSILCGTFKQDMKQITATTNSLVPGVIASWEKDPTSQPNPLALAQLQHDYPNVLLQIIPLTIDLTAYLVDPTSVPVDIYMALQDVVSILYSLTGYNTDGEGPPPTDAFSEASSQGDFMEFLTMVDNFTEKSDGFVAAFKTTFTAHCPAPKCPTSTNHLSTDSIGVPPICFNLGLQDCSAPACPKPPQLTGTNDVTPPIIAGPPPVCYNLNLQAIYNILNSQEGKDALTNLETVTKKDIPAIIKALPKGGQPLDDAIATYYEDYCVKGLTRINDLKISLDLLFTSKETIEPTLLTYLDQILADVENLAGPISSDSCPIPSAKDDIKTWNQFANIVKTAVKDIQMLTDGFSIEYSRVCKTNPQDPCSSTSLLGLVKPIICKTFTTTMTTLFTHADTYIGNIIKFWKFPFKVNEITIFQNNYATDIKTLIPLSVDIATYLQDPTNGPTDIFIALQDIQTMLNYITGYSENGPGTSPAAALTGSSPETDVTNIQTALDTYSKNLPIILSEITKAFLSHCSAPKCSSQIDGSHGDTPPIIDGPPPICYDLNLQAVYYILSSYENTLAFEDLLANTNSDVSAILKAIPEGKDKLEKAVEKLNQDYCVDGLNSLSDLRISLDELYASGKPIDPNLDQFLTSIYADLLDLSVSSSTEGCPLPPPDQYTNKKAWEGFKTLVNENVSQILLLKDAFAIQFQHICEPPHQTICSNVDLIGVATPIFCGQLSRWLNVIIKGNPATNCFEGLNLDIHLLQLEGIPHFLPFLQNHYDSNIKPLIPMTVDLTNALSDPSALPAEIYEILQDISNLLFTITGYSVNGPGPSPVHAFTASSSISDFCDFYNKISELVNNSSADINAFKTEFTKICPAPKCPAPVPLPPACPAAKPPVCPSSSQHDSNPHDDICSDLTLQSIVKPIYCGQLDSTITTLIHNCDGVFSTINQYWSNKSLWLVYLEVMQQNYNNWMSPLVTMITDINTYLSDPTNGPADIFEALQDVLPGLYTITGYSVNGSGPNPLDSLSGSSTQADFTAAKATIDGFSNVMTSSVTTLKAAYTNNKCTPPKCLLGTQHLRDDCSEPSIQKVAKPFLCDQIQPILSTIVEDSDKFFAGVFKFWGDNKLKAEGIKAFQANYLNWIAPLVTLLDDINDLLADPTIIPPEIYMVLPDILAPLYKITGYSENGAGPSPVSGMSTNWVQPDFQRAEAIIDYYPTMFSAPLKELKDAFQKACPNVTCSSQHTDSNDNAPTPGKPSQICSDKNLLGIVQPIVCGDFAWDIQNLIFMIDQEIPGVLAWWGNPGTEPIMLQVLKGDYPGLIKPLLPITNDITNYLSDPTNGPPDIYMALQPLAEMLYFITGYTSNGPGPSPVSLLSSTSSKDDFSNLQTKLDAFGKQVDVLTAPLIKAFHNNNCQNPACPTTTQLSNDLAPSKYCLNLDLQAVYHILSTEAGLETVENLSTIVLKDVPAILKAIPSGGKPLDDAINKLKQNYCVKGLAKLSPLSISLYELFLDEPSIAPMLLSSLKIINTSVMKLSGPVNSHSCPLPDPKDYKNSHAWKKFSKMVNNNVAEVIGEAAVFKDAYDKICPAPSENICVDPNLISLVNPVFCGQISTTVDTLIENTTKILSVLISFWSKKSVAIPYLAGLQQTYPKYIQPLIPITVDITNFLSNSTICPTDVYMALQDIVDMLFYMTGYTTAGEGPSPASELSPNSTVADLQTLESNLNLYKTKLPTFKTNLETAFTKHCPKPSCPSVKNPPTLGAVPNGTSLPTSTDSSCTNKYLIDVAQAISDGTMGKAFTSLKSIVTKYVPEIIKDLPPKGQGGATLQRDLAQLQYNYINILTVDIRSLDMQIQLAISQANPPADILMPLMNLLDIFSFVYNSQDSTNPFPFPTGDNLLDPDAWTTFQTQFNTMVGNFPSENQAFLAAYKKECNKSSQLTNGCETETGCSHGNCPSVSNLGTSDVIYPEGCLSLPIQAISIIMNDATGHGQISLKVLEKITRSCVEDILKAIPKGTAALNKELAILKEDYCQVALGDLRYLISCLELYHDSTDPVVRKLSVPLDKFYKHIEALKALCKLPTCASDDVTPTIRNNLMSKNTPPNPTNPCSSNEMQTVIKALSDGDIDRSVNEILSLITENVPDIIKRIQANGNGGDDLKNALRAFQDNYTLAAQRQLQAIPNQINDLIAKNNLPYMAQITLLEVQDIFEYICNSQAVGNPYPYPDQEHELDADMWSKFLTDFQTKIGNYPIKKMNFLTACNNACNTAVLNNPLNTTNPPIPNNPCTLPEFQTIVKALQGGDIDKSVDSLISHVKNHVPGIIESIPNMDADLENKLLAFQDGYVVIAQQGLQDISEKIRILARKKLITGLLGDELADLHPIFEYICNSQAVGDPYPFPSPYPYSDSDRKRAFDTNFWTEFLQDFTGKVGKYQSIKNYFFIAYKKACNNPSIKESEHE